MFRGILIRLRPVTLLVVVLAIALGSVPMAAAAQANRQAAPSGLPAPTKAPPAMDSAGDPPNPYYSVQTITLGDGARVDQVIINGPPEPPPGTELERAPVTPSALNQPGAAASLPVPAYNWVFGCSAVSASMIGAYFDRNGLPNIYTGSGNSGVMPMDNSTVWGTWSDGDETYPLNPLVASRQGLDGRSTRGSIDDYWVQYDSTANDPYITNGWAQHTWGDAFGDYMKTSQSAYNNTDGATYFEWWNDGSPYTCANMVSSGDANRDGTYGRKLFYEARGYSVSDCYNQRTDNAIAGGFSFANYKAQIDAGYPVLLNLAGHSIVGVGYADPNTVYLNDTWDHATHQMTWGGSYSDMALQSVSVVNPVRPNNPVPTITGLNPTSATAGGSAFTLTVNGTNFVSSSVVRWNGSNRTTTYVSATQLTAAIAAADIATAGTASVTVFNPAPGGGTSSAVSFSVNPNTGNPVPTITGLSPSSATPGGAGFTLTVNGTNFISSSVVRWKGANRTTTYVSSTKLNAAILASDIAAAGSASVTVFNPTPGGGLSNAVSFLVGTSKKVYLPLVVKSLPAPVLNAIDNADGDGNYVVSWNVVTGATSYTLEEDDNAGFTSPTAQYAGAGTSWNATGKAAGTYLYRVQASNASGSGSWSATQSATVKPISNWTTIVSTDFEGAWPGAWAVSDNSSADGGQYYWGKRNCRAYAGSYSGWGVGGGAQGSGRSCGASYPNNVSSWMVYGPFSLSNTAAADLSFKLWLNSELNYDGVCRFASIDGDNFWGTCTSGDTTGWVDKILDLADVYTLGNLLGQPQVWVAIRFSSDGSNTYAEGSYVDNIVLRKCPTGGACPATVSEMSPSHSQVVESSVHVVIPK